VEAGEVPALLALKEVHVSKSFVTLDDVARAAGLSRAQVSRALRGDAGVLEDTRERVRQVAAKIGYSPNLAARNLATARGTNVGLLIGEPLNPFHMQLARAVDAELAAVDYDAVVSLRALSEDLALSEVDRLMSLRIVGIILISTPHEDRAISRIAARLPCIYIGKQVDNPSVSTISANDRDGVIEAVEHLVSLGHRSIANINGGDSPGAAERIAGYRLAMSAAGLPLLEVWGNPDLDAGKRGVDTLMASKTQPTAIIAHNDIVAMGAINRLKGLGLRVPEDVSLVGFDDIPYASSETLSLSTLRQDPLDQARAAVAELRARLDAGAVPRAQILPVSLCHRRSVAPPASGTQQIVSAVTEDLGQLP
jgi:DNA-binding LacI/PurR family transcriptional regulator